MVRKDPGRFFRGVAEGLAYRRISPRTPSGAMHRPRYRTVQVARSSRTRGRATTYGQQSLEVPIVERGAQHHQVSTAPGADRCREGTNTADTAPAPDRLSAGALVLDTRTGRRGKVQDWPYPVSAAPTHAWLRPVGGGREWTPRIDDLRPINADEQP